MSLSDLIMRRYRRALDRAIDARVYASLRHDPKRWPPEPPRPYLAPHEPRGAYRLRRFDGAGTI